MAKISVVLPCRNEENGIGICIKKIKKALKNEDYEIVVSDSSSDKSAEIAKRLNARVVKHKKGYGDALINGLRAAKGDFLIFADCDNSYDFSELPRFISALQQGYGLVIGSRLMGKIEKGAMKPLHRYIGNPLLTLLFNLLFGTRLSDTHSGFRAIKRDALKKLGLSSEGMEFALEMLIKAAKKRIKVKEIPISYSKRIGESKLNSFRDGIRHIRLMVKEFMIG